MRLSMLFSCSDRGGATSTQSSSEEVKEKHSKKNKDKKHKNKKDHKHKKEKKVEEDPKHS